MPARNYNPNHDREGRFSEGQGGGHPENEATRLYGHNSGFIAGRTSQLHGHIVIYRGRDLGLGKGYAVMHEPSSNHVMVPTLASARDVMTELARAGSYADAARVADVIPRRRG